MAIGFNFPGMSNAQSSPWDLSGMQNAGTYTGSGMTLPNAQMLTGVPGSGLGTNNSTGLGPNLGTAQLGIQGLASLGNLWGAFQAQSLAKKQFDFSKQMATTNLNNQVTSYNTALSDRINSRAVMQGMSGEQVNDYLNQNRMTR